MTALSAAEALAVDRAARLSDAALRGMVEAAACRSGTPVPDILGPSRLPHLVALRAALMQAARARGATVSGLARVFGRDRSTVLHALRRPAGGAP